MKLTDSTCKSAQPKDKSYKLFDGGGLYLEVAPNGSKHWRLIYRYHHRERRFSVGSYPLVSLSEAREHRRSAKKLLEQDIDPANQRRAEKLKAAAEANNTFKAMAMEWYEVKSEGWSKVYAHGVLRNLNLYAFPELGYLPLKEIDTPFLLSVLKKVEKRGTLEVLRKLRQLCSQIFMYAIQTGRCSQNPALMLQGALKTAKTKHFAALEVSELPTLLTALNENKANLYPRTLRAIKLSLLTFLRPGEIRQAEKSDIDFDKNCLCIPAERMKMDRDHIVPLSTQAMDVIREQLEEVKNYKSKFLFPGQVDQFKAMSEGTVNMALKRLGFTGKMTAHGFRALARTAIREELNYDADVIEIQLAHMPAGPLAGAYDRTKFLKQRIKMMQDWANYTDNVYSTKNEETEG